MRADPPPLLKRRHPILAAALNLSSIKLGADDYFLLGDNRDLSEDSRLFGAVPLSAIGGRTEFVFFSFKSTAGIRAERIGLQLR